MKKLEIVDLSEIQGGNCFLAGAGLALSAATGPIGVTVYAVVFGPYIAKCWNS